MKRLGVLAGIGILLLTACMEKEEQVELATIEPVKEEKFTAQLFYNIDTVKYDLKSDTVNRGQTLSLLFEDNQVNQTLVHELIAQFEDSLKLSRINVGEQWHFFTADKECKHIVRNRSLRSYDHFYSKDGAWFYEEVKRASKIIKKSTTGIIEKGSSLSATLNEHLPLNESMALENKITQILAWEMDFFHVQPFDYFKVIYQVEEIEGVYVGIQQIDGIAFKHVNDTLYGLPFEKDGVIDFFDEDGNGLRKAFLKAPLEFFRISSSFSGRRFHPVQKRWKSHLGTDYAAPTGTPILATGEGVITKAEYSKFNGRYVKIKHNGVYDTQYLHMSRIAKGIKPGVRVKQGDVIGYVGSTGLATGPHVCYRFWKNGRQINHRKEKFESVDPILPEQMEAFKKKVLPVKEALDLLPMKLKKQAEKATPELS